jgi:hypothetical protein
VGSRASLHAVEKKITLQIPETETRFPVRPAAA